MISEKRHQSPIASAQILNTICAYEGTLQTNSCLTAQTHFARHSFNSFNARDINSPANATAQTACTPNGLSKSLSQQRLSDFRITTPIDPISFYFQQDIHRHATLPLSNLILFCLKSITYKYPSHFVCGVEAVIDFVPSKFISDKKIKYGVFT